MGERLKKLRHNSLQVTAVALTAGSLAAATSGCDAYIEDLGIRSDAYEAAADVYEHDFRTASPGEQFMFQYLGPAKVIIDNPEDVEVRDRGEQEANRRRGQDVPVLEYKFNTDCLRDTVYDLTDTPAGLDYFIEKSEYGLDSFIVHPIYEEANDPSLHFTVTEGAPTLTPADTDTRDVLDEHGCLYGNWGTPFLESEQRLSSLSGVEMYTTYVE